MNYDYEALTAFKSIRYLWKDSEKILKLYRQFIKLSFVYIKDNDNRKEQLTDLLIYKKNQIIQEIAIIIKFIGKKDILIFSDYKPVWIDKIESKQNNEYEISKYLLEKIKLEMNKKQ